MKKYLWPAVVITVMVVGFIAFLPYLVAAAVLFALWCGVTAGW